MRRSVGPENRDRQQAKADVSAAAAAVTGALLEIDDRCCCDAQCDTKSSYDTLRCAAHSLFFWLSCVSDVWQL